MTELELALKIAANPHLARMRTKQMAMRNRFIKDYGPDFYINNYTADEFNNPEIPATRFPGVRGISRWTVAEETQFKTLTDRMSKYRQTLRDLYDAP